MIIYVETNKVQHKFELFEITEQDDHSRTLQYTLQKDDVNLYKALKVQSLFQIYIFQSQIKVQSLE